MIKLISVVFMMALFGNAHVYAKSPDKQLQEAFNKGRFTLPTAEELQQVSKAYQRELTGQATPELWSSLSIHAIRYKDFLYLQEASEHRTGRGLFAIRSGDNMQPWLLQAPHAKSDLYTGKIATQLFAEGHFKAAMWNTVPRKTPVENSTRPKTADMAHLPDTYWQAITTSFSRYYKDGKIIQIHGYAQSKRKSSAASTSDMIISAGHQRPPVWVQQYAACLKKSLPFKVSLYPFDVKELGATTNVQGQLLRKQNFNGFVHIELSKQIRQQLLDNKALRQVLLTCLP